MRRGPRGKAYLLQVRDPADWLLVIVLNSGKGFNDTI